MSDPKKLADDEQAELAELAALFPEPTKFSIGNVTLSLMPMDFATAIACSHRIQKILKEVLEGNVADVSAIWARALAGMAAHPDEAKEALSLLTGKSSAFIGKLPPAVIGALLAELFRINSDFFVRSVGSLASGAWGTTKASDGAGLTR